MFAVTSYSAEELQYVLDVCLGKYAFRNRKAHLDHLTDIRPSLEMYVEQHFPVSDAVSALT